MSSRKSADALFFEMYTEGLYSFINVKGFVCHLDKCVGHYRSMTEITLHNNACMRARIQTLTVGEQNRSTYAHDVITDTLQFPDKSASSLAR